MTDRRAGEVDFEADFELAGRQQGGALVAFDHFDGLQDFDDLLRRHLAAVAGLVQKLDERQGRAIHDRHFRAVDFDVNIIDTQSRESRHNVFNGRDGDAGVIGDDGAERGLGDVMGQGGDAVVAVGDIRTHENHAGARGGRAHNHAHHFTGMQSDAGDDRRTGQGMFVLISYHGTPILYSPRSRNAVVCPCPA